MTLLQALGELGSLLLGLGLTLAIFSFVVRDNPFYRLAVHALVGAAAAYAAVVVARDLAGRIGASLEGSAPGLAGLSWLVPAALALLLALKLAPQAAHYGNAGLAAVVGVGAAVALVGAISGTLLPLIGAPFGRGVLGLLAAALAALALLYFQLTLGPSIGGRLAGLPAGAVERLRTAGQAVVIVALGALFAGLLSTSLTLLSARVGFYLESLVSLATALVGA
ncbi:MAG: hypothetical protein ACRDHL_01645 [Candidatus Promineifilaceae bacterium]